MDFTADELVTIERALRLQSVRRRPFWDAQVKAGQLEAAARPFAGKR
jgi:hypothetical protein